MLLPGTLLPDTDGHDEVHEGDGVEGDVPPVHQGPQVDQDQHDAEQDDCGRPMDFSSTQVHLQILAHSFLFSMIT